VFRNSFPTEIPLYKQTQDEHKAGPFVVTFFLVTLRKPFMKAVGSSPLTQHPATSLNSGPDEFSYVTDIYFITAFLSATGSSEWFLYFSFHDQNTVTAMHATCLCYTFQFIAHCHRPEFVKKFSIVNFFNFFYEGNVLNFQLHHLFCLSFAPHRNWLY
jgi:hypothetical protein